MRKIRLGAGAVLMLAATLISDSVLMISVYLFAAFLHEFGHLLAARLLKIDIKEIRFGFEGIRIITCERLTSYKNEILLAVSGPAVNVAVLLGVAIFFLLFGGGIEEMLSSAEDFMNAPTLRGKNTVAFLALSSLIQAIMNLLPIKTFDGGRIFYCIVAQLSSERLAQRTIDLTSMTVCLFLWTVALYLMIRIGGGLGIYVFAACIFACSFNKDLFV